MTTIILSPIKRSYASPRLKKRRIIQRKHHRQLLLSITVECEKLSLPDLLNDLFLEQRRRESITDIATILRKVGDQMDEQLQINHRSSSSDYFFGQRTITFIYCLSHVLRFFL